MEYLYKVLGIKATVQRAEFDHDVPEGALLSGREGNPENR